MVFRQRLSVRFDKRGLLRFISHRDLMRLFERALRRAGLPLAMTQGYNPHPRMSFPLALGTGMVGENEIMEFQLREWLPPATVRQALARQFPSGIVIRDLSAVSPGGGTVVSAIHYRVRFMEPAPVSEDDVVGLLIRSSVPVRRLRKGETKTVDIRPFISQLRLEDDTLSIGCAVNEGSTTRPEEVLQAMGVDVPAWLGRMEIVRTDTILAQPKAADAQADPALGRRRSRQKR